MYFAFKPPYGVLSSRASARKKTFECSHCVSYNRADCIQDYVYPDDQTQPTFEIVQILTPTGKKGGGVVGTE